MRSFIYYLFSVYLSSSYLSSSYLYGNNHHCTEVFWHPRTKLPVHGICRLRWTQCKESVLVAFLKCTGVSKVGFPEDYSALQHKVRPWPFKVIVTKMFQFILESVSGIDCFFRFLLPDFPFFFHLLLNMHFFLPQCLLANFQGFLSNVLRSELLILGYLNKRDA